MKKNIPLRKGKKNFGADPFPQNLKLQKDGFENFGGGVWRGGVLELEQAAPLACLACLVLKILPKIPSTAVPVGPGCCP